MDATYLILTAAALAAFNLLDATVRNRFTAVLSAFAFATSAVALLLLEATVAEVLPVVLTGVVTSAGFRLIFGRKDK